MLKNWHKEKGDPLGRPTVLHKPDKALDYLGRLRSAALSQGNVELTARRLHLALQAAFFWVRVIGGQFVLLDRAGFGPALLLPRFHGFFVKVHHVAWVGDCRR